MKSLYRTLISGTIIISILFFSCKKQTMPVVSTSAITELTAVSVSCGGTVTDEGSGSVTARGVCWATGANPSVSDNKTSDGTGPGSFTSSLTGLNPGTTYYLRAYATNNAGTSYGMSISFTTPGEPPSSLVQPPTNVTTTSAMLNGVVNANHLTTVVIFEYGTSTTYGQTASPSQSPVTGNSITSVSAAIDGLKEGTLYHFRIKTVNSLGTTYSEDIMFTTLGQAPSAVTLQACCLSGTGGRLNGTVNANYLSTVVTFEYGATTSYGNSVTAVQSPLTGNNSTSVYAGIGGLTPATTYHFRIKAVNSLGTTYGEDLTLSTYLSDADGNIYQYVSIGSQVWMRENLKTTRFNDGSVIPLVTEAALWTGLTSPAYSWYNNDGANKNVYGALYNWYTVATSKICPAGWHVPADSEWNELISFLGGESSAGGKLKETGTYHWMTPNTGATNATGFTALPGSFRDHDGSFFDNLGRNGYWWGSTETSATNAVSRYLHFDLGSVGAGDDNKTDGFSIRCLKD